jgi:hypothetical protein
MGPHMTRMIFGTKVVAVVMACLVVGCASTTINGVMADPGRYRDKEVTIAGEVEESLGILGRGFFKLRDGQNALWVYTSRGLPRNGSRLSTRGRVRDLASISQLISKDSDQPTSKASVPEVVRQAVGNGLVLVETDRKAQ